MSLLQKTKSLLREYRILPNKNLGQNFTIEPLVFESVIGYGMLNLSDTVLDIGSGLGFLTRLLAKECKAVIAVEVQAELVKALRERLANVSNVKILSGNVLKLNIPVFNKVVSIPPYGLSSHLLPWLFERNFDCAVLVLQKEFAYHLTAHVGSKAYGWLSILTYYRAKVEPLDLVPPSSFYPQPKVDSIIIRVSPKKPPPFKLKNETLFLQLMRSLFTQRNKKVRNAALSFFRCSRHMQKEAAVEAAKGLPLSEMRVRELTPEDFGVLANVISETEDIF
jgi:16S rRNA (adenine1518-N6/adenine1519-N6)-dimethyltransferase